MHTDSQDFLIRNLYNGSNYLQGIGMNIKFFSLLAALSFCAYGAVGSSVQVPEREHLKYTFGNHKHHPTMKLEAQRYFRTLAKLDDNEVRKGLQTEGYEVHSVELRDIASELVYEAKVNDAVHTGYTLHIDPNTGQILQRKESGQ